MIEIQLTTYSHPGGGVCRTCHVTKESEDSNFFYDEGARITILTRSPNGSNHLILNNKQVDELMDALWEMRRTCDE